MLDNYKPIFFHTPEVINCGSFTDYGGYAVDSAHRVAAQKMYMLRLLDQGRGMETKGFYL